jgi:hypothetical protein
MLSGGVTFLILMAVALGLGVSKIHDEKISILKVFLGITELQIQQFSSKT